MSIPLEIQLHILFDDKENLTLSEDTTNSIRHIRASYTFEKEWGLIELWEYAMYEVGVTMRNDIPTLYTPPVSRRVHIEVVNGQPYDVLEQVKTLWDINITKKKHD